MSQQAVWAFFPSRLAVGCLQLTQLRNTSIPQHPHTPPCHVPRRDNVNVGPVGLGLVNISSSQRFLTWPCRDPSYQQITVPQPAACRMQLP